MESEREQQRAPRGLVAVHVSNPQKVRLLVPMSRITLASLPVGSSPFQHIRCAQTHSMNMCANTRQSMHTYIHVHKHKGVEAAHRSPAVEPMSRARMGAPLTESPMLKTVT